MIMQNTAPFIYKTLQSRDTIGKFIWLFTPSKVIWQKATSHSPCGSTRREVDPGASAFETPILAEGGVVEGQRWYVALSLTIRPQFVIECSRRLNEQGMVLSGKLEWKGLTDVRRISTRSERNIKGCRMWKKSCRYLLPIEHNARTRQIDQRCHLKWMERWAYA